MNNFNTKAGLIWNIAELLRGGWKQHEYQDVILPLVVLKRLDSIFSKVKEKIMVQHNKYKGKVNIDPILKASSLGFYNISPYDFEKLLEDPKNIAKNLRHYINGYSDNVKEIFSKFDFEKQLSRLEGGNLFI